MEIMGCPHSAKQLPSYLSIASMGCHLYGQDLQLVSIGVLDEPHARISEYLMARERNQWLQV
jgi:hypothetical protein